MTTAATQVHQVAHLDHRPGGLGDVVVIGVEDLAEVALERVRAERFAEEAVVRSHLGDEVRERAVGAQGDRGGAKPFGRTRDLRELTENTLAALNVCSRCSGLHNLCGSWDGIAESSVSRRAQELDSWLGADHGGALASPVSATAPTGGRASGPTRALASTNASELRFSALSSAPEDVDDGGSQPTPARDGSGTNARRGSEVDFAGAASMIDQGSPAQLGTAQALTEAAFDPIPCGPVTGPGNTNPANSAGASICAVAQKCTVTAPPTMGSTATGCLVSCCTGWHATLELDHTSRSGVGPTGPTVFTMMVTS